MINPFAPRSGPRKGPNGRLMLGLLLIGTGRAAGFAQFGASRDAFLASLAPWLALLIVTAGMMAVSGYPGVAAGFFLVALCQLLAPAVVADLFCRLWGRREHWALYANVLNCSGWLMVGVFLLLVPLVSLVVPLGASIQTASYTLVGGWVGYLAWFHWFAARHALHVSRTRALLVMFTVLFGTALLLRVPVLISGQSSLEDFAAKLQNAAAK